jgi:hypothetical protein
VGHSRMVGQLRDDHPAWRVADQDDGLLHRIEDRLRWSASA